MTSYTYDSQHNMLTITDPRNITYLKNQYDSAGRVIEQTQADGSTDKFNWTPSANSSQTWVQKSEPPGSPVNRYSSTDSEGFTGTISNVDVTDPRGYVRHVTFNTYGYTTSDTRAVGQPQQQTTTYQYYADNLLKSVTDTLGRTTAFDYDVNSNTTLTTLLSGTANAVSYVTTYTSPFAELASATDPLGR